MKYLLAFFCCLLLSACSLFLQPIYENVSQEPQLQHIVGRCLELKQDAFLYQYSDTKTYSLNIPGRFSSLPFSIEDYLRDPCNWENTDTNAQNRQGKMNGYGKHKVIDVIPKGTKIFVSQVLRKQTLYEVFTKVIGHIDDSKYCHLPVDIDFLLKIDFGKLVIPYQTEPELKMMMGREQIPYPNPGVIEYCDE